MHVYSLLPFAMRLLLPSAHDDSAPCHSGVSDVPRHCLLLGYMHPAITECRSELVAGATPTASHLLAAA